MDFAAIDYLGRPIENPTIQIDVKDGKDSTSPTLTGRTGTPPHNITLQSPHWKY
jgi:hypothetical protein